MVAGSLYCKIFNLAGTLEGNSEQSDIEWIAQNLYERSAFRSQAPWRSLSDEGREDWRNIARAALEVLPLFMGRVGTRCREYAKVLESMARLHRSRLG